MKDPDAVPPAAETETDPRQEVLLEVRGIILDPSSQIPIVILRAADGGLLLPIWIGVFEANAIAGALEGVEPERPQTHDLMRTLLETTGARVERVLISDLRESTFFAVVHLATQDGPRTVDARPSDAIALAIRFGAPVFALHDLLAQARREDRAVGELNDEERLRKVLEDMRPEDLGKYTM